MECVAQCDSYTTADKTVFRNTLKSLQYLQDGQKLVPLYNTIALITEEAFQTKLDWVGPVDNRPSTDYL